MANRTPRLLTTTFFLTFLQLVYSFGHVSNSPCSNICSGNPQNTLQNDVVCLDADFTTTTDGEAVRECVACELNSTAVDTATNQSDVEWGLFNLRYTVSECMFAVPEQRISISNPCVVTCEPLADALSYLLSNDSSTYNPSLSFCTAARFDDTTINNCAFCYGLIPQQLFLANMLQALHAACRQPPVPGVAFFPDAQTIFNESLVSGPAPISTTKNSSGGLHSWKLALAIALPAVGGILLICGACFCCFVYTRGKRRRMAETGRMSRMHDSWGEAAAQYMDGPAYEPEMSTVHEQEMKPLSPQWMHDDLQQQQQQQQKNSPALRNSAGARVSPGLRGSLDLPTAVVGPGEGQVQDPNLHERYLGTPTTLGQGEIGVARGGSGMDHHSVDVYHPPEAYQGDILHDRAAVGAVDNREHYHEGRQQDERGQWV